MRKFAGILQMIIAFGVIFAISMVSSANKTAAASISPDLDKKGSISVTIRATDTGEAIPGGTLTLYKAAEVAEENGEYIFRLSGEFKESAVDPGGISSGAAEVALELESFVKEKKLSGNTLTVDENGRAKWSGLEPGLYLIVNTAASKGYDPVNSFCVSLPGYVNGQYVYDIDASPKAGTAGTSYPKTPEPTPAAIISDKKLPQTGQLWWPVPVLAAAGILLILLGWYRRRN